MRKIKRKELDKIKMATTIDQTRPDQTRPDQTRPDQLIVRNSSLELLRIVAMLMIIAHHFSLYGCFDFSANSITLNRLWLRLMDSGGKLGVNIFVFISGYFLVKSDSLNLRKLFNLWARILFYSVATYAISVMIGASAFSLKIALKVILPITKQLQWWFARTYFVLYLIHPYVNILLRSFSREDYKKFLLTLGLYWCIIPTITNSNFGANDLVNFICLYSLAGYVMLWGDDLGSVKCILYGLAFAGINFLSAVVLDFVALKISFAGKHVRYFFEMMRPFTIIAALFLFIGFKNLKIPHSRTINTLASATFGVYLIHESRFIRPFLWHDIFRNASYQDSPYLIPYSIAVILIIYISCTVIELTRSRIFKALSRDRLS